jgi:Peroxidase, family 2
MCGNGITNFTLDLDALAVHNRIEHDGSLVHDDTPEGSTLAPIAVDQERLQSLLGYSTDHQGLSLNDFARVRSDIETALKIQKKPLTSHQTFVAHGEVALTSLVFGDAAGDVSLERIKQWFGEERLPHGWTKPKDTVGYIQVRMRASDVSKKIQVSSLRRSVLWLSLA